MAVGLYFPMSSHRLLGEELTSAGWKITTTAVPTGVTSREFDAISCSVNFLCTAVGNFGAEAWNGSSWRVALQGLTSQMFLSGVSCGSDTNCLAVGREVVPRGTLPPNVRTFAEVRSGLIWNRPYPPNPTPTGQYSTLNDRLAAVSCWSVTACMSVGYDNQESLAEELVNSTWKVLPTPVPSGGYRAYGLRGVSCLTNMCFAVGANHVNGSLVVPIINRWDGSKWAAMTAATLPITTNALLTSVSCVASNFCMAAGSDSSGPIVESWNGVKWRFQALRTPSGGSGATLLGIDCASRFSCVAVGTYTSSSGATLPLAERYNALSA
jgi:hypothetical protein